jgi:hypothetical protein
MAGFSVFLKKKREFNSSLLAILATGPKGNQRRRRSNLQRKERVFGLLLY